MHLALPPPPPCPGLMRSAAATYAPRRVAINCVAPGMMATRQTEKFTANERVRGASEAMHPMKRLVGPDEVAAALHFLLVQARAVTGQVRCGGWAKLKLSLVLARASMRTTSACRSDVWRRRAGRG